MNAPGLAPSVATSHGSIFVECSGRNGPPLLLIHGNSSCRGVFARQLQSALADRYRLIAIDLPGHGQSDNAPDPVRTYSLPGFADCIIEVLGILGISELTILGWSLGGHIAIELLARFTGVKGLILTGTPPVRRNGMAEGFVASPDRGLPGRRVLDETEIDAFARHMFGEPIEPFLRAALRRSDGRCREQMFAAARMGVGVDQRLTIERSTVPLAVINGSADPLIKLDYLDGIAYRKLWNGRCHRLDGAGHAPFWHAADEFNALAGQFLDAVEAGAGRSGHAASGG
ncbi:MAG TPA: alpha/beta hydrolase [Geminicoccus sp.]|uniref:alpha/beta fold hydrolase n=1 Tax=Geminicoccus sp. TaxID=2024832 RepID=UPI002BF78F37|nr:alpha/beta hydrolase [Geminicoccus sp.]HWL70005.1 alpha/beta hydrolase [Geminicoccus sp.]